MGFRSARPQLVAWILVTASWGCGVDDRVLVVGPGPIAIDNFEESAAHVSDPRFSQWTFFTYNSSGPTTGRDVACEPGFQSERCGGLEFEVVDAPDGIMNYAGAARAKAVGVGSLDITELHTLSFAHRYQHDGDCAELTDVRVDLGCDSLTTNFTASVPVSTTWKVETIALTEFVVDYFPPPNGTSRLQCFKVVNSLFFAAQPLLADGQCGSGILQLDDIIIE